MASTFAERLNRIEANSSKLKLFAGDENPQFYSSKDLNFAAPKTKSLAYGAILVGVLLGALAGYMFMQYAGIALFMERAPLQIYAMAQVDMMLAGGIAGVALGLVAFVGTFVFTSGRPRLIQFWSAYVIGMLGPNAMTALAIFEIL